MASERDGGGSFSDWLLSFGSVLTLSVDSAVDSEALAAAASVKGLGGRPRGCSRMSAFSSAGLIYSRLASVMDDILKKRVGRILKVVSSWSLKTMKRNGE